MRKTLKYLFPMPGCSSRMARRCCLVGCHRYANKATTEANMVFRSLAYENSPFCIHLSAPANVASSACVLPHGGCFWRVEGVWAKRAGDS